MHNSVAQEFCILKSRYHRKHSFLLRESKMSLESNKVIHSSLGILSSELDNRVPLCTVSLIDKSNRLKRTE